MFRENRVFWDVMLRLRNNLTLFEIPQGLRLQGLQPFFRLPGRVLPLKGETSCLLYLSLERRDSHAPVRTGQKTQAEDLFLSVSPNLIAEFQFTYRASRMFIVESVQRISIKFGSSNPC